MAQITQAKHSYILVAKEYTKMLQHGLPKCRKCGKELKIGDEIVSNNRYAKMNKKYHYKCWQLLYQ